MSSFICEFSKEMVILSDGNVTTCCLDPLAINSFGNIYNESFSNIIEKHKVVYTSIANNIESMPRCRICYEKIKKTGVEKTATYNLNPSGIEISSFLEEINSNKQRLVIELSSVCNLKCNGCITSRENIKEYREKPFLDVSALLLFMKSESDKVGAIRLYNYGETFVHPDAIDFCTQIKLMNNSIVIDIATNGMMLNDEEKCKQLVASGIDVMHFSIHGGSQTSVQKYMSEKFDFNLVLKIIKDIQKIKKYLNTEKPEIVWKYLLFEWNDTDAEIKLAQQIAKDLGVSIAFSLPGFPAPSRRFSENHEAFQALRLS